MKLSLGSNIFALKIYNNLSKINFNKTKAQIKLATGKRIVSVADDTSGFNIGKSLETKIAVNESYLNNAEIGKNYLNTAESALVQMNELLTQIQAKYVDTQDPAKDQAVIADDIRSLASEFDSILKSTKYNDTNLFAKDDGTALDNTKVFDVNGDVSMDFASSSYLDVASIRNVLDGSSGGSSTYGTTEVAGSYLPLNDALTSAVSLKIKITFSDPNYNMSKVPPLPYTTGTTRPDIVNNIQSLGIPIVDVFLYQDSTDPSTGSFGLKIKNSVLSSDPNLTISNIEITDTDSSPANMQDWLGIPTASSNTSTGLLSSNDSDVLTQAANLDSTVDNVKSSLQRVGNLIQSLDMRENTLYNNVLNMKSSISRLFDADVARQQLIATKQELGNQVGTSMLQKTSLMPQRLLTLFGGS